MKAYLFNLLQRSSSPAHGRNIAREYLQARVLETLQRTGAFTALAFHGGTALRFLYATPRYSEDLDFALTQAREKFRWQTYLQAIKNTLTAEGYTLEIKFNEQRVVYNAWLRFPGLPFDLNLSPHPNETLAIKLEVDTHPPSGAGLTTTVVRRYVILQLHHHDQASLLAGKLHAVLQRPYLKGRDIYDLLWYLSDPNWPSPNLTFLNNALRQTNWDKARLDESTWRQAVQTRLEKADWRQVVADVRPFLESGEAVTLLTPENLKRVLTA